MRVFILLAFTGLTLASQSNIRELDLSFLLDDFPNLYPADKPAEEVSPKETAPTRFLNPFRGMFPDRTKLNIPELDPDDDVGEPLILTPLLREGKIEDAVMASKVEGLSDDVESYSGFFQVDPEAQGNLFFWYFPAANKNLSAPTIVWLQGGPGGSSLFGLFVENGPFKVDANSKLVPRNTSWNEEANLLYFDQPVGTGFSNIKDQYKMCTDQECVARNLFEALQQFYTMFPTLLKNELFITGESYAGKYVPAISHKIHTENQKPDSDKTLKLPLKGLAIGDGLTDPVNQMVYADYLYQLGLLDEVSYTSIDKECKETIDDIGKKKWGDASGDFNLILYNFQALTKLNFVYNFLLDKQPEDFNYFIPFLERPETRKAIHVGHTPYHDVNTDVYEALQADIPKSVAPLVEDLLNAKYRVSINKECPSRISHFKSVTFCSRF